MKHSAPKHANRMSFLPAAAFLLAAALLLLGLLPGSSGTNRAPSPDSSRAVSLPESRPETGEMSPSPSPTASPSPSLSPSPSPAFSSTSVSPLPTASPTPQPTPQIGPEDHVFAHRGASGEETEHSFAAYDRAIRMGCRYIEQDLVLSADGTLFVSHEQSALRITGVDRRYGDMTDEEIGALRTGDDQKILRLRDVFERYGDSVHYVVELRSTEQVDPFVRDVQESGVSQGQIIVQSFRQDVLSQLEAVFPDLPKMFLVASQNAFDRGLTLAWADILSADSGLMTPENCIAAHAAGKRFNVWTINLEEDLIAAIEMGVDSYFTNYPGRALALERRLRG